MVRTFKAHWPEYLMEAWGLGTFMVSAVFFTIIVEHPDLWIREMLHDQPMTRRLIIGLAMGFTAIGIIYSPWGKRSGAHLNPAVTLSFLSLKKIGGTDALFYIIFQFMGGYLGVLAFKLFFLEYASHVSVNYAVTIPGSLGITGAFLLEMVLSFTLFITILFVSNAERIKGMAGVFAGMWLTVFITFEAPYSGMSINPARTIASALPANVWNAWWVYFLAPPMGMLLATFIYRRFCHFKDVLRCHMSGNQHGCKTYKIH